MSILINNVPDPILLIIMTYIPDNYSSINFVKTCKYFKELFYKHGYIKNMIYKNINESFFDFMIRCANHFRTVNSIVIYNTLNPQYLIGKWPKKVVLSNCANKHVINPTKETDTEILYILNDKSKHIQVNWSKFPKLKYFEISDWNFNFETIDICKKLTNTIVNKKKDK